MATQICPDCDSAGDGICPVCHGKGKSLADDFSASVAFAYESACSACGGSGQCRTCDGIGRIEVSVAWG